MNIKGFRRMLFGEKMPDKNDPKYKDRYEREVSAGRKFAQATRIDKAAAKVQGFANAHRILFLVIVFGFAIGGFTWNIYRITMAYRNSRPTRTATEMQDSVLRERHKRLQGGEIRENRNENKKNMNRNTRWTTSPCSMSNSRKRLRQRKLPMPRRASKKLSRNWRKPLPKQG